MLAVKKKMEPQNTQNTQMDAGALGGISRGSVYKDVDGGAKPRHDG